MKLSASNIFSFIFKIVSLMSMMGMAVSYAIYHSNPPSIIQSSISHFFIIPSPPNINAQGFVLMDAQSGYILAQKNSHQRMQPASLTKLMTLYLTFDALKAGRIHLNDKVLISRKAWATGGSRMFLKPASRVPLVQLIQGVVVDSGNDAATALSQFVSGSEATFAEMMNQTAKQLGMHDTHYVDATGLPRPNHYTTPYDMALLTRALIVHYPEYYDFFNQKWFTFNGIRQPNRNRLLWRNTSSTMFDGLKTGHTEKAGYCLVASALSQKMRLISVVMGTSSDAERTNDSQALLNYGFRFFETRRLFRKDQMLHTQRVWMGHFPHVGFGLSDDLYITVPKGEYQKLKASIQILHPLKAPVIKGQAYGQVIITLNHKILMTRPLVALQDDTQGKFWRRLSDRMTLFFRHWF